MLESLLDRFAHLQLRRPLAVLIIVALVSAVALRLASRLEVRTGFEELLPDTSESVRELHRVADRSLGIVAVIGEIACLLAAVLVLPAVRICWRLDRARNARLGVHDASAPGDGALRP